MKISAKAVNKSRMERRLEIYNESKNLNMQEQRTIRFIKRYLGQIKQATVEQRANLRQQIKNLIKEGYCEICKIDFTKENPRCIDHCHDTLKIRGCLCRKCNSGIGMFNHRTDLLEEAWEYLKKYSTL